MVIIIVIIIGIITISNNKAYFIAGIPKRESYIRIWTGRLNAGREKRIIMQYVFQAVISIGSTRVHRHRGRLAHSEELGGLSDELQIPEHWWFVPP